MSLRVKVPGLEPRERMDTELVTEAVKRNRMRWLRHALRKDDGSWVKRSMLYELDGVRDIGDRCG